MDEPRAFIQTEVRKRKININTYIWNLENGTVEPICRAATET